MNKLVAVGVESSLILRLSDMTGYECVVEDFVDPAVYATAINRELSRSGGAEKIVENEIGSTMRPNTVAAWCEARDYRVPAKSKIAYHILDQIRERTIFDQEKVEFLKRISARLDSIFEIDHATRRYHIDER